ncbi:MAG: T9SS type A sorting domain-containing protein [Clostridiaceae bacterium]|nr:T9SS type A sorting domain-containing protein [Clostridiaceae bacterium]
MKKTLLFLALALFVSAFMKAEDVNLGDFEDGVTNDWILYGESYEIVDNPLEVSPNTSSKVLQNITINQYQGMSMHDLSFIRENYVMYSFDVYNATGAVDFIVNVHGRTGEGADLNVPFYPTTTDGAWLHFEVDLTDAAFETMDTIYQLDLQNNTAETELYWDNILLTGIDGGTTSVIDASTVKTNKSMCFPNPANSSELIRFSTDIGENSAVEIYNTVGQLKLATSLNNRLLDISSLNSGFYYVKVGNKVAKLMIR